MTQLTFSDAAIAARVEAWQKPPFPESLRAEVGRLVAEGNVKELEDRFYRTLEFGTGGLRGKLGAGTNRMNETIVGWASQGLANYVAKAATKPGPLRAAIAYDCRHMSPELARRAASVLAANGVLVHISPALRPTPYLSFAMRRLGCHTGIVVTASHNPREYNGYKVYWDDGSQVVPPHDKGIIAEVEAVTGDDQVKAMRFEDGVAQGLIRVMGEEMDEAYTAAVLEQRIDAGRCEKSDVKLVYTPLHGAGSTLAVRALRAYGFRNVFPVEEQMVVSGDFPTAASPNPEEGAALERGIALGRRLDADVVLATDPDADRLGIAVKHAGDWHLVSGNQLCPMICDFILGEQRRVGRLPERPGVVTTIVTTPLFGQVAEAHGAACPETLTGFKWIADMIRRWESSDGPTFVYGAEESYGFMIGGHCRDKDGIVAACVVAEMAAASAAAGRTLVDRLYELYARFGPKHEWQKNVTLPGREGAARMAALLEGVRRNPPRHIGNRPVRRYLRVDTGVVLDGQTGAEVGRLDLPSSPVFIFEMDSGTKAIVRPSGTEPKIKFYFFLGEPATAGMTAEAARDRVTELKAGAAAFEAEFLAAIGYSTV